jgi:hypothetical protein
MSRILVFGDSHTDALYRALAKRAGSGKADIRVMRFLKLKNGKEVGHVSPEGAASMVAEAAAGDLIASAIGGNQHQSFGLIQHPVPFDFIEPGSPKPDQPQLGELIPYRTMWTVFERGLRGKDGQRLTALRQATGRPIYHLLPPPAKESAEHILKRHESAFREAGLAERGVAPAPLRLKLWRLQCAVLESLCAEWGIRLLPPPKGTQTPEGFLKPAYYSDDATHANTAYGELVLRQLEAVAQSTALTQETA